MHLFMLYHSLTHTHTYTHTHTGTQRYHPTQAMASVMHFFLLSMFAWTIVQALCIHASFVTVFDSSAALQNLYTRATYLAYLLPALIVFLCGVSDFKDYYTAQVSTFGEMIVLISFFFFPPLF